MAEYYTLLTTAGIDYETACKANGLPIKLSKMSVGDGNGAVYNPDASAVALKREVWRGDINALIQDKSNSSWLVAELVIPDSVGGWYVREAGIWTDTGVLYAIVKYPESFKPVLANSGAGKEFYLRAIFQTSNAANVTLMIDESVVKATRAWVSDYVANELAKLDAKQSVRLAATANIVLSDAQSIDGVAAIPGDRVLAPFQTSAKDNGIYVVGVGPWVRAADANSNLDVTPGLVVSVEEGSTLADTRWVLATDGPIVLGTTALTFQPTTKGFAKLDSPAFGGIPTAPTPSLVTNSKQVVNAEFVQALLTAGLSQRLALAGGQMTGRLSGKAGAAAANNPNDCGIVFDADTGMFSPSDGVVQLVANGSVVFQNTPGGSAEFFKGVRAPKGGPGSADVSGVSGYAFSGDGDTGMFAEGGTVNAGSDLVFRVDSQEAGRLKASMKAGTSSGWSRLISGKLLQWTAISVTTVAGNIVYWSANLPTGFAVNCHQAFAVLGSGLSASKVTLTVEVLGNGQVGGYIFAEDASPRVLRIYAVGE